MIKENNRKKPNEKAFLHQQHRFNNNKVLMLKRSEPQTERFRTL